MKKNFSILKKKRSFHNCDTILALAWKDGKKVSRIMGIISYNYNKQHNENHGRFSFLECKNDPEVFHALIQFIGEWAKEKGMDALVGPLAFSDKDPQDFLIEGFNEPVPVATTCNFPYMVDLTVKEGFQKKARSGSIENRNTKSNSYFLSKNNGAFQTKQHTIKSC